MTIKTRRQFLGAMGAAAGGLWLWPLAGRAMGERRLGRVVIVGGGFGGATCARYIKRFAPTAEVTLVERDQRYVTCPFSNTVLGGLRGIDAITHDYGRLSAQYGVQVIHDSAVGIDPVAKTVSLAGGTLLAYDKLVVAPGIDFRWDELEGYSAEVSQRIPHAWKAGEQTSLLRRQLEAMPDGGVFVMAPPANPFRCPPGPYERASMIAHYFKQAKPRSKILILDAKDKFSKQPLFMQGWEQRYSGMIEWVSGTSGGRISGVDAGGMAVLNEIGDSFRGDVINVIPPQQAGRIAHDAGLVDGSGWCPVDQRTFESKIHKDVHVIGDASIAGKMPKSGFAANSQGKVCAAAVVTALQGTEMPEPSYVNTCYSLVAPDYGISVAAVYRISDGAIVGVKGAGGVSPKDGDAEFRRREADYAYGWYQSITGDVFG
jgi:sulfide dehydrogenase [flavocytochrome c] flavoprotein subunit